MGISLKDCIIKNHKNNLLESGAKIRVDLILYYCRSNKWIKALAQKAQYVYSTGLRTLFDFETVTTQPDHLLCQPHAKEVI